MKHKHITRDKRGWKQIFFWLMVLSLALILRLFEADSRGIWQDEGLTLYQVRLSFTEIIANRIPVAHFITQNTVPPLYVLLLAGWAQFLGYTLWSLRLFSIFCSLLILPLFYRVGMLLDGARSGRIAALLAAISPIYLWYAQELRMYTFLLLPATLSFGLLWAWYQAAPLPGLARIAPTSSPITACPLGIGGGAGGEGSGAGGEGSGGHRFSALAYALTAGAMVWTHYLAFLLVGAQVLWLVIVLFHRYRKSLDKYAPLLGLSLATLLLIALPLIPFGLRRFLAGQERDFYFRSLSKIVNDALHALSFGMPYFVSSYEQLYFLFPLAWLLLGLGLWQAWRRGGWVLVGLLGGGLVLPVLTLYLLSYIKPIYQNVRHLFIISPAFYLLWALGLSRLAEIKRWLALIAISLLAYSWCLSTLHYFDPPRPLKNDVRALFEMIANLYMPGEVVALNDPVLQHAFEYFAPGIPWTVLPPYTEQNQEAKEQAYEATAQQYDRVWYVVGPPDTSFDTWKEPRKWFDKHYTRLSYDVLLGQTIVGALLYDTQGNSITASRQPAAVPAEIDFGESLRFLGLYKPLPSEAQPAKQRIVIETLWTALEQPREDLQFVLRLTDSSGRIWHQEQQKPFGGHHLTSHWLRQQYLRLPLFIMPPVNLPPADYNLALYLTNVAGQALYPNGQGQPLSLGTLSITRAVPRPLYLREAKPSDYLTGPLIGDSLRLEVDKLPEQLPAAPRLPLTLQLEVHKQGTFPDTFELHLKGVQGLPWQQGEVWTQSLALTDGLPTDANGVPQFPPSEWQAGDLLTLRYELQLPATLAGQFALELAAKEGENIILSPHLGGLYKTSMIALGEFYIEPRTPRTEIPPYNNPVGAEWAQTTRLLGYQSTPTGILSKNHPEPLHLQLVWQAIAPPSRPYKVFLHLLDEQGTFITASDAFFDVSPLAWQAEEIMLTEHTFDITSLPAGKYTLLVGLYNEASQERLPIDAPNFALPMGTVEIGT